ncbi:MAG: four-carbon acid sugar kinase family protein [Melioribacteraceae bacterium]|nr:four-carbon acid sugar kinase family protein [Melioribacteraceae bacterium]
MIAVIADDFTGAAEIAGLGLRYGLKVEIESHCFTNSEADLLIIATDTRSLRKEEAYKEVYEITKQLKNANCEFIYKKTDSVFRGHIYQELSAMLEANEFTKALLVPANPSLGRKIEDGIYYIDNLFLHETNFSDDPEFALTTSDVTKLIKSDGDIIVSLSSPNGEIKNGGITIGEAVSENDLEKWAGKVKPEILPQAAQVSSRHCWNHPDIRKPLILIL